MENIAKQHEKSAALRNDQIKGNKIILWFALFGTRGSNIKSNGQHLVKRKKSFWIGLSFCFCFLFILHMSSEPGSFII